LEKALSMKGEMWFFILLLSNSEMQSKTFQVCPQSIINAVSVDLLTQCF